MTNLSDRLTELFATFERSAWRWECQGHYQIDDTLLQRWRDGLPFEENEAGRQWQEYIRGLRRRGATFERVRMLTEPLTDYLRWMISITYRNIDAGEDIRWLAESEARGFGLPTYDFYLLDDRQVAIMRFGEDKLLDDLEVVEDTDVVAQHRAYRNMAWAAATHHADLVRTAERSP